ncbi:MAG TPA: alpha/beta hydrolase [Bacteroidales bacterium]|nr:alpha/beta hydrolase [Bacteroidales bacterium]
MEFDKSLSVGRIRIKQLGSNPNRPTIIFLHDSFGCIDLWRDFPEDLGTLTNCNVFIYDRQGYGKSCPFSKPNRGKDYMEIEADILNEILEACQINKTILFGHSDGGTIALLAAAKYPEKILGIITEGAHVFVEDITLNGIREMVQAYHTTDQKTKLEKYHGNNTEALFWAWANTWTNDKYRDWSIENLLPSIKCPTLIIQGEYDEYGSLMQVDKIAEQVSGKATKLILPNLKHTPHKEAPELILEHTSKFINQLCE